jgi:cobalt-zinc-cadmium efflux system protein
MPFSVHAGARDELRRYCLVLAAGIVIFLIELNGGLYSHSLALLSDSGHILLDNLSTVVAICVPIAILKNHRRESIYRARAAFVNGTSLGITGGWIVIEAIRRMSDVHDIKTAHMAIIAAIGCAGNWVQHRVLHAAEDKSHSTHRLLHQHVLSDLAQSASVILGAIVIRITGWRWVDPVVSIIIGLCMVRMAYRSFARKEWRTGCACIRKDYIPPLE